MYRNHGHQEHHGRSYGPYITAYAIACKYGFVGTEEDFAQLYLKAGEDAADALDTVRDEALARIGADEQLQEQINAKAAQSALDLMALGLSNETLARIGADAQLQGQINTNAGAIVAESWARSSADGDLQAQIDSALGQQYIFLLDFDAVFGTATPEITQTYAYLAGLTPPVTPKPLITFKNSNSAQSTYQHAFRYYTDPADPSGGLILSDDGTDAVSTASETTLGVVRGAGVVKVDENGDMRLANDSATDYAIGVREIEDIDANTSLVPTAPKLFAQWIQGIWGNLKALFAHTHSGVDGTSKIPYSNITGAPQGNVRGAVTNLTHYYQTSTGKLDETYTYTDPITQDEYTFDITLSVRNGNQTDVYVRIILPAILRYCYAVGINQTEKGIDGKNIYFISVPNTNGQIASVFAKSNSNIEAYEPASSYAHIYLPSGIVLIILAQAFNSSDAEMRQAEVYFKASLPVTAKAPVRPLSDYSWAEIADISASGNASAYFSVGDEKEIILADGQTITLQIYGFAHDYMPISASGEPVGITLGLKDVMTTFRFMNLTATNEGGYAGSDLDNWLQGELYDSLPSDLRSVIKIVNKYTSIGEQSVTAEAAAMKLFPFAEAEVFSDRLVSAAGEGAMYPIFEDEENRKKSRRGDLGGKQIWWLRSPYVGDSASFCTVGANGLQGYSAAFSNISAYARGVCFGFCV
ncbi:MAG: DUF6273 domain-containing protein [Oscillospiraceae bacterium]|jgi:hypothetical protein|nr:DUF6273 domain-containing protein [Oscillospiraceae bacterium]